MTTLRLSRKETLVVVLTRWFLCRHRCPEIAISKDMLKDITTPGTDTMLKSTMQGMRSSD